MIMFYVHVLHASLVLVGSEKQDSKGKASEVSKEQQVPPGVGGTAVGGAMAAAGGSGVKRPGQFGSDKQQPDPKRKRT